MPMTYPVVYYFINSLLERKTNLALLFASINSLLKNSPSESIRLYLFYSNLSESELKRIRSIINSRATLILSDVHNEIPKESNIKFIWLSKLYCCASVKENRVLYLDSDTIVQRSVSELFSLDTGGDICGCRDIPLIFSNRRPDYYINTGVFFYTPDILRTKMSSKEFIHRASNIDKLEFVDQDILLNIFDLKHLPEDCNVLTNFNLFGLDGYIKKKYGKSLEEFSLDARVLHFGGVKTRPFQSLISRSFSDRWFSYFPDTYKYKLGIKNPGSISMLTNIDGCTILLDNTYENMATVYSNPTIYSINGKCDYIFDANGQVIDNDYVNGILDELTTPVNINNLFDKVYP